MPFLERQDFIFNLKTPQIKIRVFTQEKTDFPSGMQQNTDFTRVHVKTDDFLDMYL